MLDKLCKKILKILMILCNNNSYSIVEITEILGQLSDKIEFDVLSKYLNYLSDNQYIDVKYFDEKQICFAIMPKAKGLDEEVKYKKKTTNKYLRLALLMSVVSAISGFVGAFLGSYLFGLLG